MRNWTSMVDLVAHQSRSRYYRGQQHRPVVCR